MADFFFEKLAYCAKSADFELQISFFQLKALQKLMQEVEDRFFCRTKGSGDISQK